MTEVISGKFEHPKGYFGITHYLQSLDGTTPFWQTLVDRPRTVPVIVLRDTTIVWSDDSNEIHDHLRIAMKGKGKIAAKVDILVRESGIIIDIYSRDLEIRNRTREYFLRNLNRNPQVPIKTYTDSGQEVT